jgi:hypothetical protein
VPVYIVEAPAIDIAADTPRGERISLLKGSLGKLKTLVEEFSRAHGHQIVIEDEVWLVPSLKVEMPEGLVEKLSRQPGIARVDVPHPLQRDP